MRASDVISSLQQRGVTLKVIAGNLKISGAEKLSDREKTALRAHKASILRALEPPVAPATAVTEPSGPCATCGSNHYWLSASDWQCWGCTEPPPTATTVCLPVPPALPPHCAARVHFRALSWTCQHSLTGIVLPSEPPCDGADFEPKEGRP